MQLDFDGLGGEDYDLYLPSPVFSPESIEINILKGAQTQIKIDIVNRGEGSFSALVECVGYGFSLEEQHVRGNESTIKVYFDAKEAQVSDCFFGHVIFTYLGGEKVIPIKVLVVEEKKSRPPVEQISRKKAIIRKRITQEATVPKTYSIHMTKRAYDVDEFARIHFINHDLYPINVKINEDKELQYSHEYITVEDRGFIDIALKKSFFEWLLPMKKTMEKPVIRKSLSLLIETDSGKEVIRLPIAFTNYVAPMVEGKIQNDQVFKKVILQLQAFYIRYLTTHNRNALKDAFKLCEEAMAYHPTEVNLRLLYMIMMIELNMRSTLEEHVSSFIRYTNYFDESGKEGFSDILEVLYQYLNDEDVTYIVKRWPKTPYRQLFRYRVFEKDQARFRDFEQLYKEGLKSVYLFAITVRMLNERPEVPNEKSEYYRFIIKWALGKGLLGDTWLDRLSKSAMNLEKYELVDEKQCFDLYGLMPNEEFLRLLGSVLVTNKNYTSQAYSVYSDIVHDHIFLKDGLLHYVKAAYMNRLPIELDSVNLALLHSKLPHEILVYLHLELTKIDVSSTLAIHLIRRYREQLIYECIHRNMSVDEMTLICGMIKVLADRHQWQDLTKLLHERVLDELLLFDEVTIKKVIIMGCDIGSFRWLEEQLSPSLLLEQMNEQYLKSYFYYYYEIKKDDVYAREIANRLYSMGNKDDTLLLFLAESYQGTLESCIRLFHDLEANDQTSLPLMKKILFKGIQIRNRQDELLQVYLRYRSEERELQIVKKADMFFAAQILIEEQYGKKVLIDIFEEDIEYFEERVPIELALLKMYMQWEGDHEVIANNLVKKAVKNGIIFPWFADLTIPHLRKSQFRKAAFFTYHAKAYSEVILYYRYDDQDIYRSVPMKHVAFGMYIAYVAAFYKEQISFYYVEVGMDGNKTITQSGIYVHDRFVSSENEYDVYDKINTILMGQMMEDADSINEVVDYHIKEKQWIHEEMTLM